MKKLIKLLRCGKNSIFPKLSKISDPNFDRTKSKFHVPIFYSFREIRRQIAWRSGRFGSWWKLILRSGRRKMFCTKLFYDQYYGFYCAFCGSYMTEGCSLRLQWTKISYMNVLYEYPVWISYMNILYEYFIWISFMNTLYKYLIWIFLQTCTDFLLG